MEVIKILEYLILCFGHDANLGDVLDVYQKVFRVETASQKCYKLDDEEVHFVYSKIKDFIDLNK